MKYIKYLLATVLICAAYFTLDAKAANPIQYTPDVYPLLDSQYYSGTTTKAWLQVVTDGLCLNGTCRTSWPTGGSASTTITVLGVDNDGPFTFATGTPSTGLFLSLTSNGSGTITWNPQVATGYGIPLTASTTNWNTFYDTPSNRITAGTNLSWSGNTLNGIMASSTIIAGGTATHSPSVTFATSTDTNILLSVVCATSTCTFNPSWTGTLAAGRLNSNVVQAITNDTNVTGSISTQNLTLGWTGQLAVARGGTATSTTATSNGQLLGWHNASYGPWTLQAGSNITITTSTPGVITITGAAGGSGSISTSTTAQIGKLAVWTGLATLGNSILFDNGTVSGVNATSSTVSFNVQGSGALDPFNISSSTTTSLVRVTAAGNVGIGTTTPAKLLHVFGNQSAGIARIERDTGTSTLVNTMYGTYDVRFYSATSSSNVLNGTGASQTFGYGTSTASVTLADFGAAINTTASVGKFLFRPYSNGSANLTSSLTLDAYNSTAGIGSSTPYANLVVQSGSGGIFPILAVATSTGQHFFNVMPTGRVGIGSTSPASLLSVQGTSGATTDLLRVASSTGVSILTVTANGRVGVNSSSPVSLFTVDSQTSNATSTVQLDSLGTKGTCLKLKDADGSGYTYCSVNNGTLTCSTGSCE